MTDKELRTLDEMLTNLEIWSTWNKTFANEMIGICSKMRNLLADRKTEPSSSEKPNNCEHITEDGVTCAKYPACDDCLDNPLNKAKGSERLLKGKVEPTISKMEQVDEPQTEPLPKTINGVRIADAVAWADKWLEDNSVSEMWDMIRTLRDATEWQDEPQTEAFEEPNYYDPALWE